MKFFAILLAFIGLINADNDQFQRHCQVSERISDNSCKKIVSKALQCNSSIEICRINTRCNTSKEDELFKCVYCALKSLRLSSNEPEQNRTLDESSYDEYYDYDEDDALDRTEIDGDNEYIDDFVTDLDQSQRTRKSGICPKVVEAIGRCDPEKIQANDCQFDRDCPGELKCCEAACGRRVCNIPIQCK